MASLCHDTKPNMKRARKECRLEGMAVTVSELISPVKETGKRGATLSHSNAMF